MFPISFRSISVNAHVLFYNNRSLNLLLSDHLKDIHANILANT